MRTAAPRPVELALVGLGGMVGSLARAWLEGTSPGSDWDWATLGINVTGSFALALLLVLLTGLSRFAHEARLLLGTGLLGGYTTFSTFLLSADAVPPLRGLGYLLAGLVSMLVAAAAGALLGRVAHRRLWGAA